MVQRKSDVPIGVRKWGNAHGAKGDTYRRPFDGNINHTQRRDGDHRSRAESPAGSPGAAHAIHVADAPLHGGQPASMLRVARRKESDRSRWGDESEVYGQHLEANLRRCTGNCIRRRIGPCRYAWWRFPRTMAVPVPWGSAAWKTRSSRKWLAVSWKRSMSRSFSTPRMFRPGRSCMMPYGSSTTRS